MKLNIDIDSKYKETYVTIQAKEWTKEVEELVQKLNQQTPKRIVGFHENGQVLLSPSHIDYVFAESRKVYANLNQQSFEINMKLYEVENLFKSYGFSRFSKSVIGNHHQVIRFELAFNGSLCVYFKSGGKGYVSRRYVREIKKKLIL
ncbi:LytTR family DNA-binding domain-containing protein [Oceanobacillus senegalensis]|uniref:LytTR family DNA-binding domain-containing protein n=1 Tax=Oceanobacillus senegalensis TaxID=1936063 RepID=UPI000A30C15F|nr:LytTR family DNA-binding domain-containing protein [Oceanobacillus senegalensis]